MSASVKFGDPRQDYLWRRGVNTSRFEDLFLDDDDTDLDIRIGDETFCGHKFVFEDRCPCLYETFEMDRWSCREIEFDLIDVSEDSVLTIIRFVYRGDIVLREEDLVDVLKLAYVYEVDDLFQRLTKGQDFKDLWGDYAWSYLEFVEWDGYEEDDESETLYARVWQRIDENAEALIGTDGFHDVSEDLMVKFLSHDAIRAHELSLFNACVDWASAECNERGWQDKPVNYRKLMEPFIYRIRFPLMTLDQFETGPKVSGVLHLREVRSIEWAFQSGDIKSTDFDYRSRARPKAKLLPSVQPVHQATAPVANQNRAANSVPASRAQNCCKVCYANEVEIHFQPCGHVVSCRDCAENLSRCPICRTAISRKMRAILS